MKLECSATVVNIRNKPEGKEIAEIRIGDLVDSINKSQYSEWVEVNVLTGVSAGRYGFVKRKWLIEYYEKQPILKDINRGEAAKIIAARTLEFDSVVYSLGSRSSDWSKLRKTGSIDCSGWVSLLAKEIIKTYQLNTKPSAVDTYSDAQIINIGKITGIISGRYLNPDLIKPGVIVGLDNAEYSWDRGRPLDIDHVVIVGQDANGAFISQSSSGGGGVNRVPINKWVESIKQQIAQSRIHVVDLLALT